MRILTMSTLYPNAMTPSHGVFVENRLAAYVSKRNKSARVIAPTPWFPFPQNVFGRYADFARTPNVETRRGLSVSHPRYFLPPKVGMTYAAHSLTKCFLAAARAEIAAGRDFDLIDAHYLYPDGVAAVRVARALGKPVVLTARGSDVSLLPTFPRQRRMIVDAVMRADAVICVAAALKDALVELGAPAEKITVIRNGVDLDMFAPKDRDAARARFGVDGPTVASVGHLIERKGHDVAIDAVADDSTLTLLIAGDGPERGALKAQAARRGVADRVRFLGRLDHADLAHVYSAADVLVLASSREGWPNVLLEALACGAPVVAAPVWGAPEVVRSLDAGRLARDRSPEAIGEAVRAVLADATPREARRAYAERHSWDEVAEAMDTVFTQALARRRRNHVTQTPIANAGSMRRPGLLITVDTEEAFDWSRFDHDDVAVLDPEALRPFQDLCAAHGYRPLYFLTYQVMRHGPSRDFFAALRAQGLADLGVHLHAWTTPPTDDGGGHYYCWQCNLPEDLYRRKLTSLVATFRAAFGVDPIAHRAGRYGIDRAACAGLAEAGLRYDFSPSPGFDFSAAAGPDFSGMSPRPFVVDGGAGPVRVTPVSGALGFIHTPFYAPAPKIAPGFVDASTAWPRWACAPLRLSPEAASPSQMIALTNHLCANSSAPLTLNVHSTSLVADGNMYSVNGGAARILNDLGAYLSWRAKNGEPSLSFDDLRQLYGESTYGSGQSHPVADQAALTTA